MVYCTKCGKENLDEAKYCVNCGVTLQPESIEPMERRREQECFGLPHGGAIVGIIFGVILIFWALFEVLKQARIIPIYLEIWPLAVIVFGILIVIGAIYGMRSR